MKKLIAGLMAAFALAAAAFEVVPCERWYDGDTNLSLPNEIAGMRLQRRLIYGKDDQAFLYVSQRPGTGSAGQRVLTVYLYKRDWAKLEADGVCEDVRRELLDVVNAVQFRPADASADQSARKNEVQGRIGATDCLTAEFTYRDAKRGLDMRGWALVASFAGRFLKLRYSECTVDESGKPRPSSWPDVIGTVGTLVDRAKQGRREDGPVRADSADRRADKFGTPSPKPIHPFKYRPELCRRAAFNDSGFRLPLVSQLNFGSEIFEGDTRNRTRGTVGDQKRTDSRGARVNEGRTSPKVLKKMKFCPWTPSSNDVWKVDVEKLEKKVTEGLWELADGSYRYYRPGTEGREGTGISFGRTYRNVNRDVEREAYRELDRLYRRCGSNEARKLFDDIFKNTWSRTLIVEGDYVNDEALPGDKDATLTVWRLAEDYCLGIYASRCKGPHARLYCLMKIVRETGAARTLGIFNELPSRAIGNTVLRSVADDPVAWNNFAVLLYAEIANPQGYDEEKVAVLLEKSARAGNETAFYNFGVLHENRVK